jgi:hypothetical protein
MSWKFATLPLILLLSSAADEPAGWRQLEPGHYLCTEPAGKFDNYEIAPLQAGTPVTIRLKLISENFDPKWTVEAAIFFDPPGGRSRVTIGKANDDRDHIYVALQSASAAADEWKILAQYPVSNDWIDVNLNMDAKGVLQVVSGSSTAKLKLKSRQPVKTTLHCNSGVFELQVVPSSQGRVIPPVSS